MENLGIGGRRPTLKWVLRKRCVDSCGSEYGPVAASCEDGNKLSGSAKGGALIDELSD